MAYITKALKTTLRGVLSANGTSFTVLSFTDHKGTPLTYADFGGTFVVVVEQGEKIELMLINDITQNADDTATLSIATTGRHLDGKYPYTGYASGLSFTTGASVIVSNDPYTLSRFAQGTIAQSISAIWTFITSPIVPTPTSGTQAANKAYVDGIAIAGSPDASASTKGISMVSVAPVSATSPIAVGDNDPRVPTQDENNALVPPSGLAASDDNRLLDEGYASNGASYTASTIAFVNSNPDTITDSANGFVTAGFKRGQEITVTGSTSNNGTFRIKSVAAGVITLIATDALTVEAAGASVSIQAVYANKVAMFDANGRIKGGLIAKFGGTGADGALTVSSGTTNIDCGGARFVVKNYSSISITGTGAVALTNTHADGTILVLKCSGACTITSSATAAIDVSGQGASGNPATSFGRAALSGGTGGNNVSGTAGTNGISIPTIIGKSVPVGCGAAGAGGGGSFFGGTPGSGGRGGGALYIECAGALNFGASAVIKANGSNGTAGSNSQVGDGGGGGGGTVLIVYATLTANAGTIQATGGNSGDGAAGGTGINGGGGTGTGGTGGKTSHNDYGGGGAGGGGNGGNGGAAGADGNGAGGGGGAGGSWAVVPNTEFL